MIVNPNFVLVIYWLWPLHIFECLTRSVIGHVHLLMLLLRRENRFDYSSRHAGIEVDGVVRVFLPNFKV